VPFISTWIKLVINEKLCFLYEIRLTYGYKVIKCEVSIPDKFLTTIIVTPEDKEKIDYYIKGKADDIEKADVESLFLAGEDNTILKGLLEKDWQYFLSDDRISEVDPLYLLDHIHHIIRKNEIEKMQKQIQKILRIHMKISAILLLTLFIAEGFIYSYLGKNVKLEIDHQVSSIIYASFGARLYFNLPDGTKGMLNSGSKLNYSLPFSNFRQVKLYGEGWFGVSHDEQHPFKINTGITTKEVLVTSLM